MRPSFLAQIVNGILLMVGAYLVFNAHMSPLEQGHMVLLLAIAVGIHGLMHMGEEIFFNYNPLVGDYQADDEPTLPKVDDDDGDDRK